jgi:hypothetical protein
MVQVNAKIEINLMLEPSIVKIQQLEGKKAVANFHFGTTTRLQDSYNSGFF